MPATLKVATQPRPASIKGWPVARAGVLSLLVFSFLSVPGGALGRAYVCLGSMGRQDSLGAEACLEDQVGDLSPGLGGESVCIFLGDSLSSWDQSSFGCLADL